MSIYKPKKCKICEQIFEPSGPSQKYCSSCKDEGRRLVDRKRDRQRSRIINNYKEYERFCLSCGKKFKTHYSRKVYCGSANCESYRIKVRNKLMHQRRDKKYLIEKGRKYYSNNKKDCCLKKAIEYRKKFPKTRPYVSGKIFRHNINFVKKYVERFDYKLLSKNYKNNCESIILRCPEGHKWKTTFHSFKDGNSRCLHCYLLNNYTSKPELTIRDFIKKELPTIEVVYNDRIQIEPKELDLYFPKHNLAIEVCGLYWHSDTANNIERSYHYNKMMLCYDRNIRLITIFEDEIENSLDIIKSNIRQALNICDTKIEAKKCEVKSISVRLANRFFEQNYINSNVIFDKAFGLFYNNKLVYACCTNPSDNERYTLELNFFCVLKNTQVFGAEHKIFTYIKEYFKGSPYRYIKSYCDMRHTNIFNPIPKLLGFNLFKKVDCSPHYFKNKVRYKLNGVYINKTDFKSNGYDRIWDCGHRIYSYDLN